MKNSTSKPVRHYVVFIVVLAVLTHLFARLLWQLDFLGLSNYDNLDCVAYLPKSGGRFGFEQIACSTDGTIPFLQYTDDVHAIFITHFFGFFAAAVLFLIVEFIFSIASPSKTMEEDSEEAQEEYQFEECTNENCPCKGHESERFILGEWRYGCRDKQCPCKTHKGDLFDEQRKQWESSNLLV